MKEKDQNKAIKTYNIWTKEEDRLLTEGVEKYGDGKWAEIAEFVPNRNRD